jgi:hypothetical protein
MISTFSLQETLPKGAPHIGRCSERNSKRTNFGPFGRRAIKVGLLAARGFGKKLKLYLNDALHRRLEEGRKSRGEKMVSDPIFIKRVLAMQRIMAGTTPLRR